VELVWVRFLPASVKASGGFAPDPHLLADLALDAKGRPVMFTFMEALSGPDLLNLARLLRPKSPGDGADNRNWWTPDPATYEMLLRGLATAAALFERRDVPFLIRDKRMSA